MVFSSHPLILLGEPFLLSYDTDMGPFTTVDCMILALGRGESLLENIKKKGKMLRRRLFFRVGVSNQPKYGNFHTKNLQFMYKM